jgi:hypothetical protein
MDTIGLDPGQTIRIFDYSPNPRALLSRLSAPIGAFISATWFPVIHVRRGWLHGSHAVVTVRPPANHPASRSRDLSGLAAAIGDAVADLAGAPPEPADYLATASELGRWENIAGPYLPLRPHGHVEIGTDQPPPTWPAGLVLARDLMLARLLTPTLAAAAAATDQIAPYAMRVLALAAGAHPGGVELGTLPYRSHSEAMLSWNAGATDLRTTFRTRFDTDSADFATALADPIGSAPPEHAESLRLWASGVAHCWGIATALALSGQVDRAALNDAGRLQSPPLPLHGTAASPFHDQMHADGFDTTLPYWHVAHRMVVNVIYQSLSCLGLSAVQRYYLCYGLAEATDTSLGLTWSQRLSGYAADRPLAATASGPVG